MAAGLLTRTLGGIGLGFILALALAGCERQAAAPVVTDLPIVTVAEYQKLVQDTAGDNRILVVDFWATWCVPCIEMFGPLHERMAAHGKNIRLVSITMDGPKAIPQAVEFLKNQHALEDAWRVEPDTDKQIELVKVAGKEWNNLVVPVILIYDTQGQLAAEFINQSVEDTLEGVAQTVERLSPR